MIIIVIKRKICETFLLLHQSSYVGFPGFVRKKHHQVLSTQMYVTCWREMNEKSLGTSNIERQLNVSINSGLNYFKVLSLSYRFLI